MVFRVGVGKKIGGINFFISKSLTRSSPPSNKPTAREVREIEFQEFLSKCEIDTNKNIYKFLILNGYEPSRLKKEKVHIDELFVGDESFDQLSELVEQIKDVIEKTLYVGDTGIKAKREISQKVFDLKKFMDSYKERDHYNPFYAFLKEPELVVIKPSLGERVSSFFANQNGTDLLKYSIFKKLLLVALWAGILFAPYIFCWFTLHKQFGKTSKIIAFGWAAVVLILVIFGGQ